MLIIGLSFLLPLAIGNAVTDDFTVGEACQVNQTSDQGICVLVIDCPDAIRYITDTQMHPFKRCGFQNIMEIVCCPKSSEFTEKTTEVSINSAPSQNGNASRILDRHCKNITQFSLPPLDMRVIGGVNAELGEFPHMAAVGYLIRGQYEFECGGTLISEYYILTAAHCSNHVIKPSIVRLGVVDIGKNEFNPETDIRISQIIAHPNYTSLKTYHDIALMKLETPVTYSAFLAPGCLYTGKTIPSVPLTVTGWGKISVTKDVRVGNLQKVELALVSNSECQKSYPRTRKLPDGIDQGQLCAGDPLGLNDACMGDSGGPIQALTSSDGRYRILGVISFGRGCASPVPGVYTRLYPYLDWIESVIWPDGLNLDD